MTPKERLAQEITKIEREFSKTIGTLVVSAFALVAALAWNTAITKILERYLALKPESSIFSWLLYAFIVTLIAVVVTVYTSQLVKDKQQEAVREEIKKES